MQINSAIHGDGGTVAKAYGKGGGELADAIYENSDDDFETDEFYLELLPDDLQHSYKYHSTPKEDVLGKKINGYSVII